MSKEELYDRLQTMLVDTFGVPADDITPEATYWELDLDSLDVVELTLVVEEELGVRIEDEELEGITTVQQIVDAIAAKAEVAA